jgi:curved DNA-binding protein CbpA
VAKITLYQVLHVNTTAAPEIIKAAYEARMAALKDNAAPEVAAERIFIREAYELLADPVRKKLYDEKLREQFRSLSGGGMEEARPRPANAHLEHAAGPSPGFSRSWIGGIALLLAVGVIGAWVWLDHKHKVDALRLLEFQQAEEARQKAEQANLVRETVDWAKDRSDASRQAAEERRQEAMRQSDNRRIEYERQRMAQQDQMEERRRVAEQRQTDYQRQRQEQEDLRRSQQQLERDRRYLQELERNRGMSIPSR